MACTITGVFVKAKILLMMGINSFGPNEQFTPSTSTPNASKESAMISGSVPVKVLPSSVKVIVTKIGRSLFSFAANTAARISARSDIVSMRIRSAPAAAPIITCSRK